MWEEEECGDDAGPPVGQGAERGRYLKNVGGGVRAPHCGAPHWPASVSRRWPARERGGRGARERAGGPARFGGAGRGTQQGRGAAVTGCVTATRHPNTMRGGRGGYILMFALTTLIPHGPLCPAWRRFTSHPNNAALPAGRRFTSYHSNGHLQRWARETTRGIANARTAAHN